MDAVAVKANQRKTWESVASGWKRWDETMRKLTQPLTARMLDGIEPGQRVLDIASGVGEPAISIAARVGPAGSVLGTDLVEEMLVNAREHAARRGVTNVEFRTVDGEMLDLPPASFDAATMRWGLMFMPDPVACLTRVRRALKPGGAIKLACWSAPQKNPWAAIPMGVLSDIEIPTATRFARTVCLRGSGASALDLEEAGFSNVTTEEITLTMAEFESGKELLRYALDLAGPIAQLFSKVPEAERADCSRNRSRGRTASGTAAASGRHVACKRARVARASDFTCPSVVKPGT